MRLKRLAITHLPGIREGFILDDFALDINIITGPNASGKSSVMRALRHLIDQDYAAQSGALMLEAEFVSEENTWRVTRTGTQVIWEKNSRQTAPPPLPQGDFLHCYWLSMNDLLEEGETERAILERLRRELSGGFDLDATRRDPSFNIGLRHGQSQEHNFRKKEQKLRDIVLQYESLDRDRRRLPELDQAISEANEAGVKASTVERALEWLEARRERLAAEARLKTFPNGMDLLIGEEADRLDKLERKRDGLLNDQREAQKRQSQAQKNLEQTGLADNPPSSADIEARRQDLEEAREYNTKLKELRSQLAEAQSAEKEAAEALKPTHDRVPRLEPDEVNQAASIAEELRQASRRVEELEEKVHEKHPDADTLASQETFAEELRRWLRQLDPPRLRQLAIGSVTGLIFALVAATTAGTTGDMITAFLGIAAVASMGWLIWQLADMRNTRIEIEKRASEQDIEQPETWTIDAVRKRLQAIEAELAALQLQEEKARHADHSRKDLERIRGELEKLELEKKSLAEKIGFDPAVTGESVARFFHLAYILDQARIKRAEREKQIEQESLKIKERISRVADFLHNYGVCIEKDSCDIATIKAHFQALEQRRNDLLDAKRTIVETEETLSRLKEEIEEVEGSLERLYSDVGLSLDDRQALLDRCQRYEAFREERDRLRDATIREQDRQSWVQNDAELAEKVENDDEAGLRTLLDRLEAQSQKEDELREERAQLKNLLDTTGQDREMENVRLERDRALDALQDEFDKAMLADAGQFLLNQITYEHRSEREPEVLAAARERFARYTHNRYELRIGDNGLIQVYDAVQDILQGPETLSTGTRMQLLMAVRLAWTAVLEEEKESLPIFLDEALTTADPKRFDDIACNLKETADLENRQIFYLAAQPDDLIRWERAIGQRPHHIDLSQVRYHKNSSQPSDYAVAEPEEVPAPRNMTPEEYASQLGVPAVNPYQGAGAIHLFHLLRDDLTLLHNLMNGWRIFHLGQLERFLNSGAAEHAVADADMRMHLKNRCYITRIWVDLWRQGRGRPVDRSALEQSGAVSDNFIEDVSSLAIRLEGDAKALVEALNNGAVARFRKNKVEELSEWLEKHGYLDRDELLSTEERERLVLQRAAGCAPVEEMQWIIANFEEQSYAENAIRS
ncbi:MAG: hypothetical protein K9K82_09200 [Desulfobacteraceae bacterium]|nr:hypothetical protein [Desulfobacteraceae bacterium]